MKRFDDKIPDQWTLDLTFGAIARVKDLSEGKYDLLRPERVVEHPDFDKPVSLQTLLMLDFPSLWEVLFMIVEPQAIERKVTAQQFAERMTPTTLLAAREALRQEWRDFFQNLQRPDQAMALEKIGKWTAEAERKLSEVMRNPAIDEMDAKVTSEMDATLASSFGSLRASLGLTRDRTHGVNST